KTGGLNDLRGDRFLDNYRRRVLTDSSKILQPPLACSIAALVQVPFTLESCHHVVHDEAQFGCYVE
ncbi:MAG: hypothetical protein ACTJIA_14700, partial [Halomonas sp.]